MMTGLMLEQVAELAAAEMEERYRKQALFSGLAGRSSAVRGVRRRLAMVIGSRKGLEASSAACDTPVSTATPARLTWS